MRQFLDATGRLWKDRVLAGKIGSVFTSSATQHGGQESTLLSFHTTLLHHGMIIVGLPYTFEGQERNDEITGQAVPQINYRILLYIKTMTVNQQKSKVHDTPRGNTNKNLNT